MNKTIPWNAFVSAAFAPDSIVGWMGLGDAEVSLSADKEELTFLYDEGEGNTHHLQAKRADNETIEIDEEGQLRIFGEGATDEDADYFLVSSRVPYDFFAAPVNQLERDRAILLAALKEIVWQTNRHDEANEIAQTAIDKITKTK